MSIEIRAPELERRVREGIQSGGFHDADELLTKALDALSVSAVRPVAALDWSKMSGRGKRAGQGQRRLGAQGNPDAGPLNAGLVRPGYSRTAALPNMR